MKIGFMGSVCYAIGNLLRACDAANVTNEDIQKISEMDNEFAEYVNKISELFTKSTTTPKPDEYPIYKPEPNDSGKNTFFDGYCSPFTDDGSFPIIEETNINTDTISTEENVVKSNTDVKERKICNGKTNDYPDAAAFIEKNKEAIAIDIDSAYDKYVKSTSNSCTKKMFLEIADMIYPNTISSTEEVDDCIFVQSPFEGILVNKRGDIRGYNEKKNEYKNITASLCNGYMSFHYKHKRYSVGRTVLSTFVGEQSRSYKVIYKDNNRQNCQLSNLEWSYASPRTEGPSSEKIEMMCKIIVELFEKNDTIHTTDIVKSCCNNKINIGSKVVNKLLNGRYKDISDKYFDYRKISVNHGEITMINDDTNTSDDVDLTDIITDNNGDILSLVKFTQDLEYGKKLFLTKSKMNMLLENNDYIIPIMYCLKDENGNFRHPNDILKAIRNEFGKFFITLDFVSKVLFKEYLPEVTDIWFSKEEINK